MDKKTNPQHSYFQPSPPSYPSRTTSNSYHLNFPNWRFTSASCYSCMPGPPATYTQGYLPNTMGAFPFIPAYAFPTGFFTGRSPIEQDGYPLYISQQQEKPPQPYIALIAEAIMKAPERKLLLSDIYGYLLAHYPYFRSRRSGWRNSVRHNLSLNEIFVKAGRSPTGKGHYWTISEEHYEDVCKGVFRRRKDKKRRSAVSESEKIMIQQKRENEGFVRGEDGNEDTFERLQTKKDQSETKIIQNEENQPCIKEETLAQISDDYSTDGIAEENEYTDQELEQHVIQTSKNHTSCASGSRRSYDIEHLLSNNSKTENY